MGSLGKTLIIIGIIITLVGIGLSLSSRLKVPFLGKLPGDIFIEKKNFTFYFPITTSIVLSIVLSLIIYILFKLK